MPCERIPAVHKFKSQREGDEGLSHVQFYNTLKFAFSFLKVRLTQTVNMKITAFVVLKRMNIAKESEKNTNNTPIITITILH